MTARLLLAQACLGCLPPLPPYRDDAHAHEPEAEQGEGGGFGDELDRVATRGRRSRREDVDLDRARGARIHLACVGSESQGTGTK